MSLPKSTSVFQEITCHVSSRRRHFRSILTFMFNGSSCGVGALTALCFHECPQIEWISTSNHFTVFTGEIRLSAFADAFVRQSVIQFWVGVWARSWIFPKMGIMWIVFFCSGKWVVLVVVTRFFASILMWTFVTSSDMSINNPRKNWRAPNISWKNTAQPQWWRVQSFNLLAFIIN